MSRQRVTDNERDQADRFVYRQAEIQTDKKKYKESRQTDKETNRETSSY